VDDELSFETVPGPGSLFGADPFVHAPQGFLNLTLVNGVNDDVVLPVGANPNYCPIRVLGPTLAFSVSSVAGAISGRKILLWNSVASLMTITHEALTGTAGNRIKTPTGADFTLTQFQFAELIYQGRAAPLRWIMAPAQQPSAVVVASMEANIVAGLVGGNNNFWVANNGQLSASGTSIAAGAQQFRLNSADFAQLGKTSRMRINAVCDINPTQAGVTFTVGLYPITGVGGGAAIIGYTLGAVVAGSTIAFANPAINTQTAGTSGLFTMPADGFYLIGVQVSGTTAANSLSSISAQLEVVNT